MTAAKDSQKFPKNIIIPTGELWSDEPPLESDLHRDQIEILLDCLKWWWRNRNDFYATGNLTIYYSPEQITTKEFRGPDFFVVLGCENRLRKSWVLWNEDYKFPNLIIELLSNSTTKVDKTVKFDIYQNTFRTPEYFWFHPDTLEFKGFRLVNGRYQPLAANSQGWLWSEELQLFVGIYESKLRFFNAENQLIPTASERAEFAEQQRETERQQRQFAEQRIEELLARLKELGVEPND